MAEDRPGFNQINLVVRDMAAMVEFYRRLGVEFTETHGSWERHRRTFSPANVTTGFDFDLDSQDLVPQWNEGWPAGQAGPVLASGWPPPRPRTPPTGS